ncbi:hypothetical protein [Clostridium sp. UBA4548]|uniref:hypothetical protein n=1 Tax=Clostridium sp. UBA4548 TaxID=1946361 RepID=UPI0025C3E6A5|nr:hypothetical protein [Clostridium sp. UBA4548]
MKKLVGWIIIIIFSISILFLVSKNNNQYSISCNDKKIEVQLKYKGLENSVDFTKDNKGTYFIAFTNKVVAIEKNGKSYVLMEDNDFNIWSMEYYNNKLYIATKDKLVSYDIESRQMENCIENIPNYGDFPRILMKVKGDYLFITVGAATNSGVVGPDNKWISTYPSHHDYTPKKITLKGTKFGENNNGAFVPNNTENIKGQIIEGSKIGTSTVLIYNLNTKAYETFAWGVRNISGLDFSSEGKIYGTIGGMEDRGLRPVANDSDYIYEIKKGVWHGFPDFSGGDPVTSPRFSSKENVTNSFLLEKHPSNNPPAPVYQHNDVKTLGSLCIDTKGLLIGKDNIIFYDKKNNEILSYNTKERPVTFLSLGDKSNITSMKIIEDQLLLLENSEGILYSVSSKTDSDSTYFNNNMYLSLLVITLTSIVSIILLLLRVKHK